jgi:hypothetical protein
MFFYLSLPCPIYLKLSLIDLLLCCNNPPEIDWIMVEDSMRVEYDQGKAGLDRAFFSDIADDRTPNSGSWVVQ